MAEDFMTFVREAKRPAYRSMSREELMPQRQAFAVDAALTSRGAGYRPSQFAQ
jgi:hypothetical protein